MTNLTEESPRDFKLNPHEYDAAEVAGANYLGAAVQFNATGQLQNLTGAGTSFAGFLKESATAAGDIVEYAYRGIVELQVTKATAFDKGEVNDLVYATDGDTFTLVSTSAQKFGRIVRVLEVNSPNTTAKCLVYFEGSHVRTP